MVDIFQAKDKTIIPVVFLLLLLPAVFSAPPFIPASEQILLSGDTLNIIYPRTTSFDLTTDFKLHFHIYNSTGYFIKPTATLNCTFHFYNQSNNHIYETSPVIDSNGVDVYVQVNSTDLSGPGEYSYIIHCFSPEYNQAGYVSSIIYIGYGYDKVDTNENMVVIIGLIGYMLALSYFAVNWSFSIFDRTKKDTNNTNIIKSFLVLLVFWFGMVLIQYFRAMVELGSGNQTFLTLLDTLYQVDYILNITITTFMLLMFLNNLFLYLGIDIIQSFRGGKR